MTSKGAILTEYPGTRVREPNGLAMSGPSVACRARRRDPISTPVPIPAGAPLRQTPRYGNARKPPPRRFPVGARRANLRRAATRPDMRAMPHFSH